MTETVCVRNSKNEVLRELEEYWNDEDHILEEATVNVLEAVYKQVEKMKCINCIHYPCAIYTRFNFAAHHDFCSKFRGWSSD